MARTKQTKRADKTPAEMPEVAKAAAAAPAGVAKKTEKAGKMVTRTEQKAKEAKKTAPDTGKKAKRSKKRVFMTWGTGTINQILGEVKGRRKVTSKEGKVTWTNNFHANDKAKRVFRGMMKWLMDKCINHMSVSKSLQHTITLSPKNCLRALLLVFVGEMHLRAQQLAERHFQTCGLEMPTLGWKTTKKSKAKANANANDDEAED